MVSLLALIYIFFTSFKRKLITILLGCAQIWTNYINRPLPKGGNGFGAVPAGSQSTQGALGMGEAIAVRFQAPLHSLL